MEIATAIPPPRRTDLLIRPAGVAGRYIVKDPAAARFYTIGEQEEFLLRQLDGHRSTQAIRDHFEQRFGEPLPAEDFDQFIALARQRGLIQPPDGAAPGAAARAEPPPRPRSEPDRVRQNPLFWRKKLFDPDRLLTWLEPKLRFFWTPWFVGFSVVCIAAAAVIALTSARELVSYFPHVLRWQTVLAVWLTLGLVTACHELAHGLTCKRYGGEVREIGFLLIFLLPAFYCNVSDAWLFRERSKRLWVTAAGGCFELLLWAVAVLLWRISVQDSLVNYLAWVVLSVCGLRVFFNFNPLLKLDGYYLLSDLLEMPNLRQRALDHVASHLRWLLWGAARPGPRRRGALLVAFGVASWLFSAAIVAFMITLLVHAVGGRWPAGGAALGLLLGGIVARPMLRGLGRGEVRKMIRSRRARTAIWSAAILAILGVVCLVPVPDRVGGRFVIRSAGRAEVRAPVAAFLAEVGADEGDPIAAGAALVHLRVPDLGTRIEQKRAELDEARAALRLLEAGTRPERIRQQRRLVEEAQRWRDLAAEDLQRARLALTEELAELDQRQRQYEAETAYAGRAYEQAQRLYERQAISIDELELARRNLEVARSMLAQAEAKARARRARGAQTAEQELARRQKQLAEARAELDLLEAGSRPEEVRAAEARVNRIEAELRHLEQIRSQLEVCSPIAGAVTTPRLRDRIGDYFEEGELICEVEDLDALEVEIALPEHELRGVEPDQPVELKARSLPFETLRATVARIAPRAAAGDLRSTVTVYCSLDDADGRLRPGLSGHARIRIGRRPLAAIAAESVMRFVRTELWW